MSVSVLNHNSDDEDDVGEEILDEFRTLFVHRTNSVSQTRRNPVEETAKVLESCLFDLDRQKDVMLQTLGALEQNNADRMVQMSSDLAKALRNAEEWERRSADSQTRVENFQHDVHALVNVLSLAYHSGQWKFASVDFRTVTADMLPPTGASSKEAIRVTLLEKQLAERGRKIQALQQEMISGSAQHRLLKDQVAQRDNELSDLRRALETSQEQLSTAQHGLQLAEQETGQRHTSLVGEVQQRDALLSSLQAENARLQQQHASDAQVAVAAGDSVARLGGDVQGLTADLRAEQSRSGELRDQLATSRQSADELSQTLAKQEAQVKGLMERLNSQISELQSNVQSVEEKYKHACSDTKAAQAELNECCDTLQCAQADATTYRNQVLDCRAKLEQWETSVQLMRTEHGAEVSRREKSIQELEIKLQASEAERWSIAEDLSNHERTMRSLEEDFNSRAARHRWQMASKCLALEQQKAQVKSETLLRIQCEESVRRSEQELNAVIGQLGATRNEVEASAENGLELEQGNAQLQSAIQSSQAALTACQQQLADERDLCEELRAELESVNFDYDRLKSTHNSIELQITDRDHLINELRSEMEGASEQATTLAKQHSLAHSELLHSREEAMESLQRAQFEIGEKASGVSRLQSQLADLQAENADLQEKVSQLAEAKLGLQNCVSRFQQQQVQCDEAEYDKVELQGELEKLRHEFTLATTDLSQKEQSLEAKHAELIELESSCVRYRDMIQGRDEEIVRLQSGDCNSSGLVERVEELQLQVLEMKDDVTNANCSMQRSQDEAEQWKQTCDVNEANADRFKAECERVRKLLVLKTEELGSGKEQVAEIERDQRKMLQEVHAERDRSTQLQIEVNLLRHHRSEVEESLTRELESLRSHTNYIAMSDQLTRELDGATLELTQLRRSLATTEEEHDKLLNKLRMEQDHCGKLQARCTAAEAAARKAADVAETSALEAQNAEQVELHQVKQANAVLTAELTQRQSVIDLLRKDVDELKVQARATMHELKLKRIRVQQADQDIEAQRIQNSVLKEKIMAHERQQTMLEVALEKSQEERQNLSRRINELSNVSHAKIPSALSLKAIDLEGQVASLSLQLNSSQGERRRLNRLYDDSQAEVEACKVRHQAETAVLEQELCNLRAQQNNCVADCVHQQLVGQLQATVNTLSSQADKTALQQRDAVDNSRSLVTGDFADSAITASDDDDDDDDESLHSHSQPPALSHSARFLRNVTITQWEGKCRNLESELSASRSLHGNMLQREQQRLDDQRYGFEREREVLRRTLSTARDDLRKCRTDMIEKDREIFKLNRSLERAESSRQDHLRKVTDIEASLDELNSPRRRDGDDVG